MCACVCVASGVGAVGARLDVAARGHVVRRARRAVAARGARPRLAAALRHPALRAHRHGNRIVFIATDYLCPP